MRLQNTLEEIEEHFHSQNSTSTVEVEATMTEDIVSQTADDQLNQTKVSTKKKNDKNAALKRAIYSLASCRRSFLLLQLARE